MYRIVWDEAASEDLDDLPPDVAERITKKVQSYLVQAPRKLGEALAGQFSGLYRYRIGDYRVIYEINDDQVIVYIVHVGHRKDVYE